MVRSDSLVLLVEVELLSVSALNISFEDHVVGTDAFCNSLHWKSWNNEEWNIDSESWEFGCTWGSNFCLVSVKYLPSLVCTIMAVMYNYCLTFNIFSTTYIKSFSVLDVDELLSLISKDLVPSWVSAPDLHIVGSTRALDVPRLVVVSGSDGQWLLMEIPNLSISSIWCLDNHVSVVDKIKVSVFFHLWYNMEIFLDNETELFIHFTLAWFTFPFVNIDDVPLLMKTVVSFLNTDVSVLLVNVSNNFHHFSSLIDDVLIFESEHLPPSWVCGSASKIVWVSVGLDV